MVCQEGVIMGVVSNPLKDLQDLLARVQAGTKQVFHEWGEDVTKEQKARVPVKTGTLRDSIKKTKSNVGVTFRLDTKKAPYAKFVEFGMRSRKYKHTPFFYGPIEEKQSQLEDALLTRLSTEVSK
ncbi:hypothetical protein DF3PA_70126 [Candidatus Defluviicoccus seviourii]|uniref:Phage protein, HK97 gp10 family n=1 Tax=Candidatus Defluviicoccus seviourii TaxID=2565273 RepID=A0A564WH60_9PROT|nr:hypothetical protein DF3PA_70126 [Candidatus Defluviicoccus seviourii]